jgi:hypothetical protein
MQQGFELLEQKVRRAAELVKRLRQENETLSADQARLKERLETAERALAVAHKQRKTSDEDSHQLEAASQELKALRQEREDVRRRIEKLVEVLDGLD